MKQWNIGDKLVPTKSGWDKLSGDGDHSGGRCSTYEDEQRGGGNNIFKYMEITEIKNQRHCMYRWTSIDINDDTYNHCEGHDMQTEDFKLYKDNNNKKITKIMTSIKGYIKNLTLTTDQKLMIKHGLRDEQLNPTQEAIDATINKLVLADETYHIEIAKGLEAEEKSKCC